MAGPIRWGILGLGKIAHSFAKDLALVPDATLVAVASRDHSKAEAFAAEYGTGAAYGSYGQMLEDPAVDVVYIATPHTHHLPHSLEAMRAGKHVLCEKPMGINPEEVDALLTCAREEKVFFMEALWSRFNPALRDAVERVHSGEGGPVAYLKADFAFPALDRDPSGRLLNPNLAGGSLLDIGIYPVFLAYWVLGMPDAIRVSAKFHETGVEKQIAIVMEYPQAMALLYSGLSSHSEMRAEISCESGTFTIDPRWHETQGYSFTAEGPPVHHPFPKRGKGYTYEIEEVQRCLRKGRLESALWSHEDSRVLHGLLYEIRRMAGIHFPSEG
ncbi:Gfo/Idh/MocA family protein [Robiginitalea sediminis]|uniref:Gfo/Idh/MocA family protein n=1 Tax=Robiginitalea sediminis TaxID=1982593 RepID=UPI000B4BDAB2|nr:Gfo/Idh/MocA family oxidoreductase [Robiginitalea sediminis]